MQQEIFTPIEQKTLLDLVNFYFRGTDYLARNLDIKVRKGYLFDINPNNRENQSVYLVSLDVVLNNRVLKVAPISFEVKTTLEGTAYRLVYKIWGQFDKKLGSILWRNLLPHPFLSLSF